MVGNLKGIHHVLEAWRVGRDRNGWKWSGSQWKTFLVEVGLVESGDKDWKEHKAKYVKRHQRKQPKTVDGHSIKRLLKDLQALRVLFSHEKPPRRLVRGSGVLVAHYGFGDASGQGFGAAWESKSGINYRFGVWGRDDQGKSSNYRELNNLVETVEVMGVNGELKGVELHLFTDNSTAERAYYKGSSTSETLHELVTHRAGVTANANDWWLFHTRQAQACVRA